MTRYVELVRSLGPDRARLLATTLERLEQSQAPAEIAKVPAFLAAHDRARVRDALRYLRLIEPQGFSTAMAMIDRSEVDRTVKNHASVLQGAFSARSGNEGPKDQAESGLDHGWRDRATDRFQQILAGEEIRAGEAELAAYRMAALNTIQSLFDNRFGNDGRLKHEVGLVQADLRRFDLGPELERVLIPLCDRNQTWTAQMTALRFTLATASAAPSGLRAEVIKKMGEMGTRTDLLLLLEHREKCGGDEHVLAERAIRAIGNRVGWWTVMEKLRDWDNPARPSGMKLVRELERIRELTDQLRRFTGGPHAPDAFFTDLTSECVDIFLEEGRSEIRKQIQHRLREESPRMPPEVLETATYLAYHERLRQVFTVRSAGDVRPDVRRSSFPEGTLRMGGDTGAKFLFTIDEDGLHVAPEQTPITSGRGHLVHTNLSSPSTRAFTAGELRFVGPNEIIANCASGRYGPSKEGYEATIRYLQALGFKVHAVAYMKFD